MSASDIAMMDNSLPLWWRLLNIPEEQFERSKYAAPTDSKGKFRLKDVNILRKIAPEIYESAAEGVKEYSDALFEHKGNFVKHKLGRKLGSIPLVDVALNPELAYDHKAQDKYFQNHPEMKTHG